MTTTANIASASDAAAGIDPTFPVAGQDNNSQGFRDNFSYTQTSLEKVVTVLEDFNTNVARKDVDNDFNGVQITNAEINQLYGTVYNAGTVGTSPFSIDVRDGTYQTFTVDGNKTLRFSNWPASDLEARLRIELRSDGSTHTVNFATTSGTIYKDAATTIPFTLSSTPGDRDIFEVWSTNGGNIAFIKYLGRFA